MKKFLIKATAGLFVLSLFMAPVAVFASEHTTCTTRSAVSPEELESLTGKSSLGEIAAGVELSAASTPDAVGDNFGLICAFSLVSWVSGIVFLVIGVLAVLVIAYSALLFITGAGNEDKLKSAKAYLLYGAVGVAVAALASLIPAMVRSFFGG